MVRRSLRETVVEIVSCMMGLEGISVRRCSGRNSFQFVLSQEGFSALAEEVVKDGNTLYPLGEKNRFLIDGMDIINGEAGLDVMFNTGTGLVRGRPVSPADKIDATADSPAGGVLCNLKPPGFPGIPLNLTGDVTVSTAGEVMRYVFDKGVFRSVSVEHVSPVLPQTERGPFSACERSSVPGL